MEKTLEITAPSDREIVVVRDFDAPRRLVFDCMTKPDLLRRWMLGPPGWTMPVCEIDLRVGGAYRYVWHGENGEEMGMGGVYQEVAPPDRLVATELFDGAEDPSLVTSELVEHGGRTTLTTSILYPSKAVRDAMLATDMAAGMEAGYARLDALLAA
ncbi:MAG: SRPBCC family protein [Phenylobacterium sp.]|uniref:SRPBCC family protein n=1 Tax=Phenylobacterium sp. TaxID=1871053 RepID=UPI0027370300|nr:SRPBCC family protein [Phenylobacterium sp.]MDP3749785.1 SRPBCC family protein [Phenylobacterium sp.]